MSGTYVEDSDFTLYVGDVREVLAGLPDGSVDCVVTSPPYWGLRDYGTGVWAGGDPGCDHAKPTTTYNHGFNERWGQGAGQKKQEKKSEGQYAQTCEKCGASRVDQQIGLEPTPELYVEQIVAVFRQVRRVLADHGTCFVNLGDSYMAQPAGNKTPSGFSQTRPSRRKHGVGPETVDVGPRKTGDLLLKPKDLVGVPWRVAFALQADGWYLRSDIIWSKPNPMPESVTDRPTKAHEYVFLLSKQPRYFFDQEGVREPHSPDTRKITAVVGGNGSIQHRDGERWPNSGRNVRSVWEIATQPYPEAHFATFPEALAERCIKAGTPEFVCTICNTPVVDGRQSEVAEQSAVQADVRRVRDAVSGTQPEVLLEAMRDEGSGAPQAHAEGMRELPGDVSRQSQAVLLAPVRGAVGSEDGRESSAIPAGETGGELEGREGSPGRVHQDVCAGTRLRHGASNGDGGDPSAAVAAVGVRPSSERNQGRQPAGEPRTDGAESASRASDVPALQQHVRDSLSPCCGAPMRPGRVLDPFMGSGTVALVARNQRRHSIGVELNAEYARLCAKRLQQLSLLAEGIM